MVSMQRRCRNASPVAENQRVKRPSSIKVRPGNLTNLRDIRN